MQNDPGIVFKKKISFNNHLKYEEKNFEEGFKRHQYLDNFNFLESCSLQITSHAREILPKMEIIAFVNVFIRDNMFFEKPCTQYFSLLCLNYNSEGYIT